MQRARFAGFAGITLVLVIAVLEVGSALVLRAAGEADLEARLHGALMVPSGEAPALPGAERVVEENGVLHPYLGFVQRPQDAERSQPLSVEQLGFPHGGPFVREADPNVMVIGIFGGSVAQQFVGEAGPQRLYAQLRDVPELTNRRAVIVSAALGGYKQPQQLLALSYLLSLGLHLDWVISLDGFNEVVLPLVENAKQGVFPFFPVNWPWRVAPLDTATDVRSVIGEIAYRRELRAWVARAWTESPLSSSRLASLAWVIFDRHAIDSIEALRARLASLRPKSLDYLGTGPPWSLNASQTLPELVAGWKRSTLLMDALCRANGIRFVGFVQPNQYLVGTKPMSDEERRIAIREDNPYAAAVVNGYPQLLEAAAQLRTAGIEEHDLTRIFEETKEIVYADSCCHLNARGNEILAGVMAAQLRAGPSR